MWTATGEYITYTNWLPGEPNNWQGNEHYINLNFFEGDSQHGTGKWNDIAIDGNNPQYALCESNQKSPKCY